LGEPFAQLVDGVIVGMFILGLDRLDGVLLDELDDLAFRHPTTTSHPHMIEPASPSPVLEHAKR
jgi:hypothetical protein